MADKRPLRPIPRASTTTPGDSLRIFHVDHVSSIAELEGRINVIANLKHGMLFDVKQLAGDQPGFLIIWYEW